MSDSWWRVAEEDEIEQGQVLNVLHPQMSLRQFEAAGKTKQANMRFENITAIVATQSCDLLNGKAKRVVLSRMVPIVDAIKQIQLDDEKIEQIRQGRRPSFLLLPGINDEADPGQRILVDFRFTVSLPVDYINSIAKDTARPALTSPYLEHFSSAFGRYFSRVALPKEVPPSQGPVIAGIA